MNRTIEIIIGPGGEIQIDAVGFKGADCEKATQFLGEALGGVGKKIKKPESLLVATRLRQRLAKRRGNDGLYEVDVPLSVESCNCILAGQNDFN